METCMWTRLTEVNGRKKPCVQNRGHQPQIDLLRELLCVYPTHLSIFKRGFEFIEVLQALYSCIIQSHGIICCCFSQWLFLFSQLCHHQCFSSVVYDQCAITLTVAYFSEALTYWPEWSSSAPSKGNLTLPLLGTWMFSWLDFKECCTSGCNLVMSKNYRLGVHTMVGHLL